MLGIYRTLLPLNGNLSNGQLLLGAYAVVREDTAQSMQM